MGMAVQKWSGQEPALTLDIGTRKVVGLLTVPERGGLRIVAAAKTEHRTRAMFDGQVHDVVQVAEAVAQVKSLLEARTGLVLRTAAVAAAGRALRTFRGAAQRTLQGVAELTERDVYALEMEAVQRAQGALAEALRADGAAADYHYVGHSVAACRLDGVPITSLVGHRGNLAELDVIATFLPRLVVDSLLAVLARCELQLTALTLEPMAAIAVAVPPGMRHLNLALVDVGAGTSDIALTQRGAVVAYDMVPCAGDAITEALSEARLLDFATGEQIKRQLSGQGRITFGNILGQHCAVDAGVLVGELQPAVDKLAGLISQRILALNGGAPQAVILVGGGSLTPGLPQALANAVGIGHDRVAVRGRDAIAAVSGARTLLKGPDAITPIGIAVTARENSTPGFAYVQVAGQSVRLVGAGPHTVGDALLAAGVPVRDLVGRPGLGITVTVDGELRIVAGTTGRPAEITLNGKPAALSTAVAPRDSIEWKPAIPGQAPACRVDELVNIPAVRVSVDGKTVELPAAYTVNGAPCPPDHVLADRDEVVVMPCAIVGDALAAMDYQGVDDLVETRFTLRGVPHTLRRPHYRLTLDGAPAEGSTPVQNGNNISVQRLPPPNVAEALSVADGAQAGEHLRLAKSLRVLVNGQLVEFKGAQEQRLLRNGRPASADDPLLPGDALEVTDNATGGPIFAELLNQMGFSPAPPPGKHRLVMSVNGSPAEFITPLRDGDRVQLNWE